jgi:hypothetical protein
MNINLSEETIQTVINALKDAERSLLKQIKNEEYSTNKFAVLKHQLNEVMGALETFEELV